MPAAVSAGDTTEPMPAPNYLDFRSIWGENRYATAAALSRRSFEPAANGPDGTVFVATGEAFADALAAGPAAASIKSPVLLAAKDRLPAETAEELVRLAPREIVLLGGTSAVSAQVETALREHATTVSRISGEDRYETAAAVSRRFFPGGSAVAFVATGRDFADALAGGAVAGAANSPVLLVDHERLPPATATELRRLGARRVSLLGGPAAVSDRTMGDLQAIAGDAIRLAGEDRFATAVEVSKASASVGGNIYIATGAGYADALAGAAVAGKDGFTILLTGKSCMPQVVAEEVRRLRPSSIVVLGGPEAIVAYDPLGIRVCVGAVTNGPRIRLIRAVPAGSQESANAEGLVYEATSVMEWFAGQTGGVAPRFETDEAGDPTLRTVHLPWTFAQLNNPDLEIEPKTLEDELVAQGHVSDEVKGLVYLEGGALAQPPDTPPANICGQAGARIAIVYMLSCERYDLFTDDSNSEYLWFLPAHELTHVLGAVAECAPHHGRDGHVVDDNRDLLYSGGARDWANIALDPGRDDYYMHDNAGCPDIADSAFLAPRVVAPPVVDWSPEVTFG